MKTSSNFWLAVVEVLKVFRSDPPLIKLAALLVVVAGLLLGVWLLTRGMPFGALLR